MFCEMKNLVSNTFNKLRKILYSIMEAVEDLQQRFEFMGKLTLLFDLLALSLTLLMVVGHGVL
jgi:hypothetical protein